MGDLGFKPCRSDSTAHLKTNPFFPLPLAGPFGARGTENEAEGRTLKVYLEDIVVVLLRMTLYRYWIQS